MTPDDWIDLAASALYNAERQEHPDRRLPAWDLAGPVMRADARYRAIAAHMRGNRTVKAVLVEVLAQTLATLDGYVWPACEARTRQIQPEAEYQARVAQRRQDYRHKAREVITAHNKYLDLDAFAQPEEHRIVIMELAARRHREDIEIVKAWRRSLQWSRGVNHEGERA